MTKQGLNSKKQRVARDPGGQKEDNQQDWAGFAKGVDLEFAGFRGVL